MAKQSRTDELFEMLRARGLRTRVARALSDAADAGRSGAATSQKTAMGIVADLRNLADELEDRFTGGKAKARREAAQKAARTRQRKATARSTAAKKGAATRKRSTASSSASTPKRAASTAKRAASTAKRKTTATAKRTTTSSASGTRRRAATKKT